MVMIAIFVLAILAGGFAYSMKVETRLALNANSEAELEWLGRSGVEYCRWILAQQLLIPNEPYDALNQVWAGGPGGMGTSNSPLAEVQQEVRLGNGSFTWKITDLESKANINTASEMMLRQAFTIMGADPGDLTPASSAILDWIDPDDSTHIQGAESDFYQALRPPYYAKNGPIDDLSELLLVAGVTPDVFWGPTSTNHPVSVVQPRPTFARPGDMAPVYPVGLVDLFTPLSTGKININTASAAVLQLTGIDSTIAEAIVGARGGEDDGSGLAGPYRSVDQVRRVPEVNMMVARMLQPYCDVRSKTFEVTIDAQIAGYHRQFIAILGRNSPRDIQVLNFYWK